MLASRRFAVTGLRQVVGRSGECDILLPSDDLTASRLHAVVSYEGDQFIITDHNSLNGTYVNGRRIACEVLRPGDVVRLGGTEFVFEAAGISAREVEPSRPAVGSYQIINTIGTGGMATVYLAQSADGGYVAIKVPLPQFQNDREFAERFRREVELGEQLDHPNVVRVRHVVGDDGALMMVMDYADGGSLRDLIQPNSRIPFDRVCDVARQCCAGLEHAHQHGIVHRDVKPENILLTRQGVVKLADFGIARIKTRTSITYNKILGSPYYMSPEQARGSKDLDGRSDLYSLCVVLYELSTGRVPFVGNDFLQIMSKHISEAPVSPARIRQDMPPAIEQAIMRGLEKNPDSRPASAAQLSCCFS
jgi:serine/threonine-protein kinase